MFSGASGYVFDYIGDINTVDTNNIFEVIRE